MVKNKSHANAIWRSPDSKLGFCLGFIHAMWHFSESTHQSSPPTVVRSDNPIITAILNGLFRSEVSRPTVCTASPSALTRLCRFMQIRPNPQDARDFGVPKSVRWSFLCCGSQGGTGVTLNERRSPNRRRGHKDRVDERCDEVFGETGGGRLDEWEDESERAAATR